MANVSFEGFHGTSKQKADSMIRQQAMPSSIGEDHWYGSGVYFFVDGVTAGLDNACKWANVSSWCNRRKCLTYTFYGVVKAQITTESERILDLRNQSNLSCFERFQSVVVNKMKAAGKRISDYKDSMVFDLLAEELNYGAFIGHQYIQLTPEERRSRVNSRIPNTTMMCVRKNAQVVISDLSLIAKGAVTNG